jgi:hypothetical protein
MGVTDKDILVDHKDGNALNCVRSNLRVCNFAQNNRNRKKPVSKESSYKGVRKHRHGRWRASIKVNGVTINLGVFDVELDAARAYDAAASKHFGEFAKTNLESAA